MIDVFFRTPAPLYVHVYDGNEGLFPRAFIKDISGTFITYVNLVSVGDGDYTAPYTFSSLGYFTVCFKFFTDGSYSTEDEGDYPEASEVYRVIPTLASSQHVNRMSTSLSQAGLQEVLTWHEVDGALVNNPTACVVTIKDGVGTVIWTQSSSTPDSDGVFRFTNSPILASGINYYIVIVMTVNTFSYINIAPFFTAG